MVPQALVALVEAALARNAAIFAREETMMVW